MCNIVLSALCVRSDVKHLYRGTTKTFSHFVLTYRIRVGLGVCKEYAYTLSKYLDIAKHSSDVNVPTPPNFNELKSSKFMADKGPKSYARDLDFVEHQSFQTGYSFPKDLLRQAGAILMLSFSL